MGFCANWFWIQHFILTMIFETATQKFYHVLLNKSQFKFFLKAEVFLDHRFNELEGFWCWSQSPRWEADAWALSVTPVCSTSPTGCFPAVELLGCTLSKVKDLCERFEQSAADQSCSSEGSAQMLLHRHLLFTSSLKRLIFFWNRFGFPYPSFHLVTWQSLLWSTRNTKE